MTAKELILYQAGARAAIESAARNKRLPLIGAILVLITSIPRNYDQTYIGETPWWPIFPLIFSTVSGAFIYGFLRHGFIGEALHSSGSGEKRAYLLQFLGLFWMTAPVAWLYGIPVERFADARSATILNLSLLGLVSAWRVALLSRIVLVVFKVSWWRAAGWVLAAASFEMAIVLFFRAFGAALAKGMGGMRNSPEEDLIKSVLSSVFLVSLIAFVVLLVVLEIKRKGSHAQPPPPTTEVRVPSGALLASGIIWLLLAIRPQLELEKEFRYAQHLQAERYRTALDLLIAMNPNDWPPAKPFRPNPYEWEVWHRLPPLFGETSGSEPEWVRGNLLRTYEATFDHWRRFNGEETFQILEAVERFPGGSNWIRARKEKLQAAVKNIGFGANAAPDHKDKLTALLGRYEIQMPLDSRPDVPNGI